MRRNRTLGLAALAIVLFVSLSLGVPAAESNCTDTYIQCIDDAYDHPFAERQLYYVECGVRYAACLRKVMLGI